jgi:hypothetical protein
MSDSIDQIYHEYVERLFWNPTTGKEEMRKVPLVGPIQVEINGLANLHCIIQLHEMDGTIDKGLATSMRTQLDILERYMLELGRASRDGRVNAPWHEVRDNAANYPLNREQK